MKLGTWITGFCGVALLAATAMEAQADTFLLRMGGGHTTGLTYVATYDTFFADEVTKRVKEKAGHDIRFIKAWGGSVAKVDGAIEAVQRGTLDIGLSPIGFEQSRAALLNYSAMVPFTTADPVLQGRVATRMLDEVPSLQKSMKPYNAHILSMMVTEAYGLATNFDWTSIDELKGRRIAMAGTNAPLFVPIEAVPVNLGIGEHYQAMQTGLAEGSLFFISGMEAFRLKEVASTFTRTGFGSLSTFVAFMNEDTRARLPEEVVKIIDEVAAEAAIMVAARSAERDKAVAERLEAEGITVRDLSDEERARWAKAVAGIPANSVAGLADREYPTADVLKAYIRILAEEGYSFPTDYTF
ncbi:TRAP transporter substrate-binding protein DctP [Stappia sp. MMSF_3263]|uniref:TRAP transporter substrate-binding protein DctP n=1 Tax=Stappia sp. MMSF_3263 TaxID=3046693 RepID=UPI00273EB1A6|nr:TRAP transporter substrate-binding protein DctP [Stappia sp. MMSF_3263]